MSDTVTLSLVSHTNAGKTTLTRTLLRRDVGEVRDAPHVTLFSEEHVLLRAGEAELRLWDTPGFGDSARLLKRLKRESNPVVWFISQTWDRMVDRPLWCSQQALKNVREAADVVLYLVNAAETPGAAGYLAAEMEILSWVKKPLLVLLNQVVEAPSLAAEIQEVEAWRTELKRWDFVCGVLTLDAFTQCWVQEDRLMGMIAGVVDQAKSPAFAKLKETWHAEHVRVFEDSMAVLAEQLTASALDGEEVRTETILEKVGIARGSLTREFESARKKMTAQLAQRMEQTTNRLIELHGLSGIASRQMIQTSRDHFQVPQKVHESIWSALGGAATGAAAGLLADLKAGGLSFGGGALLGTLGGGLGAYALAKATNLVRGGDTHVHWSREHFLEQVQLAVLSYLAVTHFGRGRGSWEDTGAPVRWREATQAVVQDQRAAWDHIWKLAVEQGAMPEVVLREARRLAQEAGRRVLQRLYPASA